MNKLLIYLRQAFHMMKEEKLFSKRIRAQGTDKFLQLKRDEGMVLSDEECGGDQRQH